MVTLFITSGCGGGGGGGGDTNVDPDNSNNLIIHQIDTSE